MRDTSPSVLCAAERSARGRRSCGNCGLIRELVYPPAPEATHPGEVYRLTRDEGDRVFLDTSRSDFRLYFGRDDGGEEPHPSTVLRRLVHCRNLVDGPDGYAEHYEGVEHPGLDADLAAACAVQDERLARRLAERITEYAEASERPYWKPKDGMVLRSEYFADILAICREEVARWAEPVDFREDATPGRPDGATGGDSGEGKGE